MLQKSFFLLKASFSLFQRKDKIIRQFDFVILRLEFRLMIWFNVVVVVAVFRWRRRRRNEEDASEAVFVDISVFVDIFVFVFVVSVSVETRIGRHPVTKWSGRTSVSVWTMILELRRAAAERKTNFIEKTLLCFKNIKSYNLGPYKVIKKPELNWPFADEEIKINWIVYLFLHLAS